MTPLILRILLILSGIIVFITAFLSYSYKKLNERILLGWSLFALLLILVSVIPVLSGWIRILGQTEFIGLFLVLFVIIFFLFKLSEYISILSRKNQELAMHVSLLNQENERILSELQQLTGKNKTEL